MRSLPALALLLLAACSPPQAPEPAPETPAVTDNSAILAATPADGQWFFSGEDGTISAGFGVPESEYQFIIVCEAPTGRLTFTLEHELAPDQDTELNLITTGATIHVPARSSNEGLAHVYGTLDGVDPRLDALAQRQEFIGAAVAGYVVVLPWDESIPRALDACGV